MIKGVGIDIASVEEMRTSIEDQHDFLHEVFTEEEVAAVAIRPNAYECFAARFAAKEAFMKAIGSGWTSEIDYLDIAVQSDGASIPTIELSQRAEVYCMRLRPFSIRMSISHTAAYACAVVILDE
ncbi:holo-ACP synthase [Terriglobus albidus]|uniref:holo-ACP synthase n=1 Tax=Terriglobus albidus TaxID=1592106 RepID=UPI0021E02ECA|nr:holo-ACP synthase [Terriglobus albidus]